MVEPVYGKYAKYVVTETQQQKLPPMPKGSVTNMAFIDDDNVKGSWNLISAWFHPRKEPLVVIPDSHHHDEPELLAFFGSDMKDLHELNAEVELWMEDTKMTLTKSCLIFVPAKMKHSPLKLIRVDKPIFHFSSVAGAQWIREH